MIMNLDVHKVVGKYTIIYYYQAATWDPAIALDIILCNEVFPMTTPPNPEVTLFYMIIYKKKI